ncbi:MAG: PAS domain S-box protein [Candidatus Riflebacteria bacterium]|nr:PAS domain S-box protein [Candidatus Riflebacteria bacterium]
MNKGQLIQLRERLDAAIETGIEESFDELKKNLADITDWKQIDEELRKHHEHLNELVREKTASLEASERRIRSILETVLDAIIVIDDKGIIEIFNPAASSIFGYSADEVIGENIKVLMPEPVRSRHDGYLKKYQETRVKHILGNNIEMQGLRKNGDTFPLDLLTNESSGGEKHFFTGVIRDISERKTAETKLRNLALVAQETGNMVIITNSSGLIEWVNPGFSRATEYSIEEVIGKKPGSFLQGKETDPEMIHKMCSALQRKEGFRGELLNYAKSGRKYWVELNIQPVFNRQNELEKFVSIQTDVTERKNNERKIFESERRTQLLKEVAISANAARTIDEVFRKTLEGIAGHSGWPIGHVFLVEKASVYLKDSGIWYAPASEPYRLFLDCRKTICMGRGFAGRIWSSGKPLWISDLTLDSDFQRASEALATGLRAGFGFPVIVNDEVAAILEFFSTEVVPLNEEFLHLFEQIGVQLGILIERKKAEDELVKLVRAVENSPATVLITNNLGEIEYVNPKFCEITGYSAKEVLGKNPRILNSKEQPRAFYRNLWDTILSGNEWHGEFCNKRKNGELYWEQASISPIRDNLGNITHFVAVKEDITERRSILKALLEAKEVAENASRTKSEFLANMSHEIRTPLNAIIGFSSLIQKTQLTPRQEEFVNKIHHSGESLLGIVNDILDFSKIEAGKLGMEEIDFDLNRVINDVVSMITEKVGDKGLEFILNVSMVSLQRLRGDPLRLGQVLTNLVANAIKFTEKGKIELSIKVLRQTASKVQLSFEVLDTGIGMSIEQTIKLFKPFSQADGSMTRRFGGTGLGLSICKRLVEMMGGNIWVKSEPGKGSIFSFDAWFGFSSVPEFEHQRSEVQMIEVNPVVIPNFRGVKVLLVEDNELNQEIAMELLQGTGMKIQIANNGTEAINILHNDKSEYSFDVILMDIQMPDMDGYEVSRRLRNDSRFEKIPIIAMTAHAMSGDREKSLKSGMNDYVTKPIDPQALFATLSRWCKPSGTDEAEVSSQPRSVSQSDLSIPVIDGINVRNGLQRLLGKREMYFNLLSRFAEEHSETAIKVSEAIGYGNVAVAERLIHSFKGIAGNLGAEKMQQISQQLEQALKKSDSEKIHDCLNQFGESLRKLIGNIKTAMTHAVKTPESMPMESPDISLLAPLLSELASNLRRNTFYSVECFRKIKNNIVKLCKPEEFMKLENALSAGEFDEALECVKLLADRLNLILDEKLS